jgi:hydroxymethylbilane synthase
VVGERGLTLSGLVGDVESGRVLRATAQADLKASEALGREVAQSLLDQGAAAFLATSA